MEGHSRELPRVVRSRDVDACFRQHFRFRFQIQRRNGLLGSDAGARNHAAFERVGTPEHAASERNPPASMDRRISLDETIRPRQSNGMDDFRQEAVCRAPAPRSVWASPAARFPKRKLSPTNTARASSLLDQNLAYKFFRSKPAISCVKGRIKTSSIP